MPILKPEVLCALICSLRSNELTLGMPLQIGWLDMKGLEANILVEEGGVLEEEAFVLQKLSTTNRAVPGRLKGHHLAYEALGAEPYIVGLVKHGYKLVWEGKPPPP